MICSLSFCREKERGKLSSTMFHFIAVTRFIQWAFEDISNCAA